MQKSPSPESPSPESPSPRKWTRRQALSSLGLVAVAGSAAWTLHLRTRDFDFEDCVVEIQEILPHVQNVSALGRRYLEQEPMEAEAELLAALVFSDSEGRLRGNPRKHLEHWVREDYAAGRIVRLDGWILSRTEGRLAALVAVLLDIGAVAGAG